MKKSELKQIIREEILKENSPGFDVRKSGEALPTLDSVKAAYEANNEEGVRSPDGSKARKLQKLIDESINLVDESLSYKDFADAVALQLEDTYGGHNYQMFLDHLRIQLGK